MLVLAAGLLSCKSKPSDAAIRADVEKALSADPLTANTMVSVQKGVVTISGECEDEQCRSRCEELAKSIKGVNSVVNQCTVAAPPPPVEDTIPAVDERTQALADALKDLPGLQGSITNGKIILTGNIEKNKWTRLKETLDKLKPENGYELSGLIIQ